MDQRSEVGLADLRQRASDVIRRVEAGEEFIVTVSGRPAARLVGLESKSWIGAHRLGLLFDSLPPWGERERGDAAIDDELRDPWDDR